MKKNQFENLQTFSRGALFSVLAGANSNLLKTAIVFVLLETIWLVIMSFFKKVEKIRSHVEMCSLNLTFQSNPETMEISQILEKAVRYW